MMKLNLKKGFTLIELLVVIAIIGILSAIVLTSLSSARNKGKDASAQASLSEARSTGELYYGGTGANSYGAVSVAATTVTSGGTVAGTGGFCQDNGTINLLKAVASNAGSTVTCTVGSSASSNTTAGTSYAAYVTLNGSTTGHSWCVDSSGFSGDVVNTGIVAGVAGTDAKCK